MAPDVTWVFPRCLLVLICVNPEMCLLVMLFFHVILDKSLLRGVELSELIEITIHKSMFFPRKDQRTQTLQIVLLVFFNLWTK